VAALSLALDEVAIFNENVDPSFSVPCLLSLPIYIFWALKRRSIIDLGERVERVRELVKT
jgi:hypothetical protein